MLGIMNYVITTMQPTSLYKSLSPFLICYLAVRGYAAAAAAATTTATVATVATDATVICLAFGSRTPCLMSRNIRALAS